MHFPVNSDMWSNKEGTNTARTWRNIALWARSSGWTGCIGMVDTLPYVRIHTDPPPLSWFTEEELCAGLRALGVTNRTTAVCVGKPARDIVTPRLNTLQIRDTINFNHPSDQYTSLARAQFTLLFARLAGLVQLRTTLIKCVNEGWYDIAAHQIEQRRLTAQAGGRRGGRAGGRLTAARRAERGETFEFSQSGGLAGMAARRERNELTQFAREGALASADARRKRGEPLGPSAEAKAKGHAAQTDAADKQTRDFATQNTQPIFVKSLTKQGTKVDGTPQYRKIYACRACIAAGSTGNSYDSLLKIQAHLVQCKKDKKTKHYHDNAKNGYPPLSSAMADKIEKKGLPRPK